MEYQHVWVFTYATGVPDNRDDTILIKWNVTTMGIDRDKVRINDCLIIMENCTEYIVLYIIVNHVVSWKLLSYSIM